MTRRHTPGPWVANTPVELEVRTGLSRRDMGVVTGNAVISTIANRWIALAQVATHSEAYKSEEGQANARLIASAPELLDALKEMQAAVFGASLGDEPNVYADYDRLSALAGIVSGVIAKAECRT